MAFAFLPFECASVLQRLDRTGRVDGSTTAQAHADLLDLAIDLGPYEVLAPWGRRHWANLSAYDAAYIALSELLDAPLITVDRRLAGAPGLRAEVRTPPPPPADPEGGDRALSR